MKTRWIVFVAVVLGVMIVNSALAQTYVWKKYDDFNSGVINPDKWHIDNSCASISIGTWEGQIRTPTWLPE